MVFTLRQLGNSIYRDDPVKGRAFLEESIQLSREIGDRRSEANGLNSLGNLCGFEDDYPKALEAYERARDIFRELGARSSETMTLGNLSFVHTELGDLESAEREAKMALAINREIGGLQFRVAGELSLGDIYIRQGRNAEAWKYALMAAATGREAGLPLSYMPFQFGVLKLRKGDRATGLAWIGFARKHEEAFQKEINRDLARMWSELRGDLTDEQAKAAMKAGEGLKFEEIMAQVEREGA
jgi:tetratricopeptide (TPR) repeat protein